MSDPALLTATGALARIRAGTLTPAALAEACLGRIDAREPALRAFAFIDRAQALRAAATVPDGALHGLPIGVKDVIDVAGMPTGQGSDIWAGWRPRADAAAVAWARAAGAVVLGKTVTTEFATRRPGPTVNPHRSAGGGAHTPGGSSSGSAAGVAAGMFPLAFGTQTAGSVIRPAAYCGVVGYKPSFGTINRFGMRVMADSLDTIGAMARSVADCALFVAAVSGRDLGDPDAHPGRAPRIGLCRSPAWHLAAPETHALLARVADALARAGAAPVERELSASCAALETAQPVVMNAESARSMGWELATAADRISPVLRERLAFGLARTDAELADARAAFVTARHDFPAVMDGLDVLVTPAAPGAAPEGLDWTGDPAFNLIWTALHVPCVTVPAGVAPNGMPLGIQIVGRHGEDRAVLAWAQWVAAALA